ncbi:CD225/dispanin family protein [Oryzobacter telluris]|uniref:CD225/dispanin family protein n=1 Tax=Oryzobacter telluris TaxID=3149179 RepID=UPI00370D3402
MSDYGSTPPPPPPGDGGGAYGAPPPPMGGGQIEHPKGMTILILGILSLVCCSPLGIAAFVMGNTALKEIDAQPGRYSNRQIVQIGRILGIIGMVLLVLGIIWIVFLGGLTMLSGSTTSP